MPTLRTVSILDAWGGEKPGFYEGFRLVTINLVRNRVSEVWSYKILSLGGGGFIDIVDLNERLLVNPPLQEFMK